MLRDDNSLVVGPVRAGSHSGCRRPRLAASAITSIWAERVMKHPSAGVLAAGAGTYLAGPSVFIGCGARKDEGPGPPAPGPSSITSAICRSGLAVADALLDPLAQFLVHVPEVPEGAL